jgi:hypothetical protein
MGTTVRDIRTVGEERYRVIYSPVSKLGLWASIASVFMAVLFSLFQLLSWLKIIPSPQGEYWLFLPSLLLAPAFLVTMICLHYRAPMRTSIWSALGMAFAVIYCTLTTLTYFNQVGAILPSIENGEIPGIHPLVYKARSFTMSIDCIGYFFMGLSTLFTAFAFRNRDRGIFKWMLYNGLVSLVLVPAFFYSFLHYAASIWLVTFSMSMIYTANFMSLHVFADELFYNT